MRLVWALVGAVIMGGQVPPGQALAVVPPHWRSLRGLESFADARAQLQALVDVNGRRRVNRLCVVGERADGFYDAWVYWPARHALVLWSSNPDNPQAIVDSNVYLDLRRDVVADDAVDTSTYRQRRSKVAAILAACRRVGDQWVLTRKAAAHG